jgi:hypothetical protein
MVVVPTLAAQSAPPVRGYLNDSSLALLRPLIGRWRPLVVYNAAALPPGAMIVAEDFRWTFGGKSIHYRENYVAPNADSALVEGTIYWNPATERVEFRAVSVAGAGYFSTSASAVSASALFEGSTAASSKNISAKAKYARGTRGEWGARLMSS